MHSEMELDKNYLNYRRVNLRIIGIYAFFIYLSLFLVDYNLVKRDMGFFFTLRSLFILPMAATSYFAFKMNHRQINFSIMVSFVSVCTGLSIISRYLGGISSDYYFGLLIISFVQYAFTPLSLKKTICLDIMNGLIFFSLNTYGFDFSSEIIIQQITNFLSFSILKYIVVNRSQKLLKDALKKATLEEELKGHGKIKWVLGELCHLFSNPLFISMSTIKKMRKNQEKKNDPHAELRKGLEKALEANQRMESVLKKMLEIQEVPLEKITPEFLREYGIIAEDTGRISLDSENKKIS